jgi:phosphoribosylglycinamide formyltransferase 1
MKQLAIFASGAGSNALNLLKHAQGLAGLKISCIMVDTATSRLPEQLASQYPALPVLRMLPDMSIAPAQRKLEFEKRMLQVLREHHIDWILLAGYMRLIGPTLLQQFPQRIINIHPSLLPQYPGLNAYERAYADGVTTSGVTIHLVDAGLDSGPVILQRSFSRLPGDTLEQFIQKGKALEWELYPEILNRLNNAAELLPGV